MYICDSRWYIPSTYTKEPASLTNNRDHCRSSCTTGDLYEIRSGIERSEIDGNWVLAALQLVRLNGDQFPRNGEYVCFNSLGIGQVDGKVARSS